MAELPPPDSREVQELLIRYNQVIVEFYRSLPPSRRQVVTQLAALAAVTAIMLHGTERDAEAVRFFRDELDTMLGLRPGAIIQRVLGYG